MIGGSGLVGFGQVVERVARAMAEGDGEPENWRAWLGSARLALGAVRADVEAALEPFVKASETLLERQAKAPDHFPLTRIRDLELGDFRRARNTLIQLKDGRTS